MMNSIYSDSGIIPHESFYPAVESHSSCDDESRDGEEYYEHPVYSLSSPEVYTPEMPRRLIGKSNTEGSLVKPSFSFLGPHGIVHSNTGEHRIERSKLLDLLKGSTRQGIPDVRAQNSKARSTEEKGRKNVVLTSGKKVMLLKKGADDKPTKKGPSSNANGMRKGGKRDKSHEKKPRKQRQNKKTSENGKCAEAQVEIPKESFYKNNAFSDIATVITTSDLKSPAPLQSFSPNDPLAGKQRYKLRKVVDELIESEESYVTSLKMLLHYYIQPLYNGTRHGCGTALVIMQDTLIQILKNHTELYESFRICLSKPCSENDKVPIYNIAAKFGQLICKFGIDTYNYEEYTNMYEDVLKLVRDYDFIHTNNRNIRTKEWVKGWENYLESTQPNYKRMDLSFISLVQKPISRIGKYQLMIESMLGLINVADDPQAYHIMLQCCSTVRGKLKKINDSSKKVKDKDIGAKVNSIVNFYQIANGVILSLQYFGKCLLVGSLTALWIENSYQKFSTMGALLYKSHLLLCEVPSKRKKSEIKFIVPLSVACIYKDPREGDGGLYTNYPYSVKIVFEDNFCFFEILLSFITRIEYDVWQENLQLLINYVNGPYKMDYSSSFARNKMVTVYPDSISPYDISLSKTSNYTKFKTSCYFRNPISINVMFNFYNIKNNCEQPLLLSSYFNYMVTNPNMAKTDGTLIIRKNERINVETVFEPIWSEELPQLFLENSNGSSTIKKSSSWSHFKKGMSTVKYSRSSHSFSEGLNSVSSSHFDKYILPSGQSFQIGTTNEFLKDVKKPEEVALTEPQQPPPVEAADDRNLHRMHSRSLKLKNAVLALFQTRPSTVSFTD